RRIASLVALKAANRRVSRCRRRVVLGLLPFAGPGLHITSSEERNTNEAESPDIFSRPEIKELTISRHGAGRLRTIADIAGAGRSAPWVPQVVRGDRARAGGEARSAAHGKPNSAYRKMG